MERTVLVLVQATGTMQSQRAPKLTSELDTNEGYDAMKRISAHEGASGRGWGTYMPCTTAAACPRRQTAQRGMLALQWRQGSRTRQWSDTRGTTRSMRSSTGRWGRPGTVPIPRGSWCQRGTAHCTSAPKAQRRHRSSPVNTGCTLWFRLMHIVPLGTAHPVSGGGDGGPAA